MAAALAGCMAKNRWSDKALGWGGDRAVSGTACADQCLHRFNTTIQETRMFRRHLISLAALSLTTALAPVAMAQGKDIKIAHI